MAASFVLACPRQSQDLNPIRNLWQHLKIAVHRHSQFKLTEMKLSGKEEWAKAEVKGDSTNYRLRSAEYKCTAHFSDFYL